MRIEFDIIESWIKPNARILDVGCGSGELLEQLRNNKSTNGLGIEINPGDFDQCIAKGLSVINQNINQGLENFTDNSFDTVVMTLTLQAMRRPDQVLLESLRIGETAIITFPNFGHWRSRLHLLFRGKMPVSEFMPYEWYDTPNIHFCTIRDFEKLCNNEGIKIENRAVANTSNKQSFWAKVMPNWFAQVAIYHLSK
ncbi:MAG: methionine biosynthesis protein MetW [Cellvibrionales bacterium]|nr:methionine biosynthesis protein MetW [Cellvibrionales bacterium]